MRTYITVSILDFTFNRSQVEFFEGQQVSAHIESASSGIEVKPRHGSPIEVQEASHRLNGVVKDFIIFDFKRDVAIAAQTNVKVEVLTIQREVHLADRKC
jgi:hypothetical protein